MSGRIKHTMRIPTTHLGKNGPKLPRLGLGLAALGRPGYINLGHGEDFAQDYVIEAMERRTHRMLDAAYEQGIRYFDVARSYGRGEAFLHSWLEGKQPDDVFVGSKWGYTYTAEWRVDADQHEVKEHSLHKLKEQWSESRKLRPYLQLYQIHSATLETGVLDNKEVLAYLAQLKSEGVKVGLSVSGPKQGATLERAMRIAMDGEYLFDTVQATFNILEQSMAKPLAAAAESGMGVIIKEALANGRLTPRNADPTFAKIRDTLSNMARKHEVGMDALSLAFVLAQPWANVVLSGAAVETHLASNVQATQVKLSDDELEHLQHFAQPVMDYWRERSTLEWN